MTRFFVTSSELLDNFITLTGENATHAKVLRLQQGELVIVCDGQGRECICTVSDINPSQVSLVVQKRQESASEPSVRASVYMAFSKGDKLEHVIQKATELGAYEIVAFPSARSISRPDEKSISKKLDRWQKIAASAAEQSGRGCVPKVRVLRSFKDAIMEGATLDLPILFYENEQATTLRMALENQAYKTVALLTGPEGGLEPAEVALAAENGFSVCTLGRRILRCETAPLCALSAVMYACGEF